MYAQSSVIKAFVFKNGECASSWHRPLLPIITPFISLSSSVVSVVAPTLPFSRYFYLLSTSFIITVSASLNFRLACLVLRLFQGGRAPQRFILKNICLISM